MISDELKKRRMALKMTQPELAKRLLVTTRTIQNWEAGEVLHPLMRNGWQKAIEEAEQEAT